MVIVIIAGLRNEHAQATLQSQLDKIQHNTETPPQVTVNVPQAPPPQVVFSENRPKGSLMLSKQEFPASLHASPFFINLHLMNKGGQPIPDAFYTFKAVLIPIGHIDSAEADRGMYKTLLEEARGTIKTAKQEAHNAEYFGVGDDHWGTLFLQPTPQDIQGVLDGTTRLYIFVYAEWDKGTSKYMECKWMQAPAEADYGDASKLIFHLCQK